MDMVDPAIDRYMKELTPARDVVLAEMEAEAERDGFPIIGPLVGRFLQQLVHMTSARRVFEMGSGYGYSAIWMARAMGEGGTVECTETDPANVERGKAFAQRAGVADRIVWHTGDAREAMRAAAGPYDIILNDINKDQYPEALAIAWPKLRRGGVMVTDNVLWSGRIIEETPPLAATQGVLAFTRQVYALPDVLCTIVPLRDGLLVAVKM